MKSLIIVLISALFLHAQDTLLYTMKSIDRHRGTGCSSVNPDLDESCSRVTFSWPVITGSSKNKIHPLAIKKINTDLEIAAHAGIDGLYPTPERAVDSYLSDLESIRSEFDQGFNFSHERQYSVLYNDETFFSIARYEGGYTGGAHPNYIYMCENYFLPTASEIDFNDIFDKDKMKSVLKEAEAIFRKLFDVPSKGKINDHGFWFDNDTFHFNGNFYVTRTGITVVYNPYEVAAYAVGIIELHLPHKKFSKYYSPWGPLQKFASDK